MDGYKNRTTRFDGRLRTILLGSLAAFAVISIEPMASQGGPIRSHPLRDARIHSSAATSRLTWRQFLNRGLKTWEVTPPPAFPSGIHLASVNGRLVETAFVDYLLFRRGLDPARFDAHHPNIALPLAQLLIPPATITPVTPINPQPQGLNIPEPGSLLISLITFGSGFAWLQRQKRRSGDPLREIC